MSTNIRTAVTPYPRSEITGVVLAGGRGRRMGGVDKGLIPLNGKPMIAHAIGALRPQVEALIINANRNLDSYTAFGHQVVPDMVGDYFGPLAGMASAMEVAVTQYVLTVPCDSPLVPWDLGQRLYDRLVSEDAEISVAHDGERMHPVFTLLQRSLLPSLRGYLEAGERKIDRWFEKHRLAITYFNDVPETFLNVNSPEERVVVEARLAEVS
ncbi:MAG: molybdenum cofactor guanylyltransferase MobA [Acidiferrobacterales bacterium]